MSRTFDELRQSITWNRTQHPWQYRLRRVRHHLTHPTEHYRKLIYWPIRTFVERGRRGWSVRDTWSLDVYISRVLAESLEHLRSAHGYPYRLTPEEWDAILVEMADGFRAWANHWEDIDSADEAYRKALRSIRLMHRWFGDLWD